MGLFYQFPGDKSSNSPRLRPKHLPVPYQEMDKLSTGQLISTGVDYRARPLLAMHAPGARSRGDEDGREG